MAKATSTVARLRASECAHRIKYGTTKLGRWTVTLGTHRRRGNWRLNGGGKGSGKARYPNDGGSSLQLTPPEAWRRQGVPVDAVRSNGEASQWRRVELTPRLQWRRRWISKRAARLGFSGAAREECGSQGSGRGFKGEEVESKTETTTTLCGIRRLGGRRR